MTNGAKKNNEEEERIITRQSHDDGLSKQITFKSDGNRYYRDFEKKETI